MSTGRTNNITTLDVSSADILRLIQAHLTDVGLHQTVACLQTESGVGMAGSTHNNWQFHAESGQWALVLQGLSRMDKLKSKVPSDLLADCHEMAILEVADQGDLELAYAAYRLVQTEFLEESIGTTTRGRALEQTLAHLASLRANDAQAPVPDDYYGPQAASMSKQARRSEIGERLRRAVPQQPARRLPMLLQQAIQWQVYTGQLPTTKVQQQQQWDTEDDHQDDDTDLNKKKKRKRRQEFDLVLGQVKADIVSVAAAAGNETTTMQLETEPIVSDPFAIIKLGKHVTCEAAAFLPLLDSLVTGSSDGLIEIWDAAQNYETLNLNLPYQKNDELLGHDNCITALAVSNDASLLASGDSTGLVKLWRVDTGTCVRTVMAHEQSAVRCLHFSPDASHLLTTAAAASRDSCAVREFGLRTARMLKEFRGHDSFVNCCSYQVMGDKLVVVTGSGDGTVRMWDGKTADVIHVLRPTTSAVAGSSLVVDATSNGVPESAAIHSILHLHTPASTMVIVPRGNQAYLVTYTGTVLRTFQDDGDPTNVYLAAAISSSNQWLYAVKENGACCVFRVATGDLTKTISDFAAESTRMPTESKTLAEISAVASHPTKSIVGAYSNNKGQKRGQMVLWK